MFDWIANHSQIITTLANLGMLIVWIAYLHLFVNGYRRQRRPKILINRGAGARLDARCLVSNMSADAIYVQSIIATLDTTDEKLTCSITDLVDQEERKALPDLRLGTRQGPLRAGHVMDIGTFHSLVDHILGQSARRRDDLDPAIGAKAQALEITIVAVYGSEDLLTGARRRFDIIRDDGDLRLKACTVGTEQIRSRRERKKIADVLKDDL